MKHIILVSFSIVIILVGMIFYFVVFGVPIHDLRMGMLKRAYSNVEHPAASKFLADAVYFGGPATHGSWRCNYVVGEARSAPLSNKEIQEAYGQDSRLEVLFFDDEWPNELPWFTWESEFSSFLNTTDTPYLVYIARRNVPFLGDVRCDD